MNPPSENQPARVALKHSEHKAPAGATPIGPTSPQQIVSVSVIVCRKNPLHLHLLEGRQVSHEEFLDTYAADPASFNSIRKFAQQHGLTVDEAGSSLARRTIVLRGPAQAMEQAFGVTLHDYESNEKHPRRYHGFEGTISLPEEHAGIVEAVLGLDARPIAKPHLRIRAGAAPAVPNTSYTPVQVAQLYNFPTGLDGTGQTIGIIELGGGFTTSDITQYFQGLGLAVPTVTAVSVDGASNAPGDPNGADGEVMLDIEVAGAVAPGAKIAVYFAPNSDQGFQDAITTAVHDQANKPSVISISWGGPESSWTTQAMNALDQACASAGALGVTVTVAAGDNGSTDGVSDGADHADFPASSPHVLSCGGTTLIASGSQIQQETVWNELSAGGGATGGGVSTQFPLPTWQANANVPTPSGGTAGRGVPDVSGDADPQTGYDTLVDGQAQVIGGTSAVAPLWAGLLALINQSLAKSGASPATVGFINPVIYQASSASAFHDITQGNNGDFSAGPGWDACTGVGTPIGQQLLTLLSTPASTAGGTTSNAGGAGI
jgi:kumamolisin